MTTRYQTADLLKGIAVLLMIQVHILELFASNTILTSSFGKILMFLGGPPVAPVFTLVLGYFMAASKKSTSQLIIRGVKIIFLGMLLNLALNLNLIVSVYKGLYQIDVLPYIFGVDILHFAGLSIIFLALTKKIFEKNLILIFVCIGVSAFLGHFLLNYIPETVSLKYISALFYGSTEWSYFPFFPWIAFPLLGMAFYKLQQENDLSKLQTKKTKLFIAITFLLFLVFTIKYAVFISSNLSLYYHHGFIFACWVILFLAFYSFFMNEADKILGKTNVFSYLKWLGKNVTVIYVIQWIITGNAATEIYKTVSSPLFLFLSFLTVLVISSLIALFITKIKERVNKKI